MKLLRFMIRKDMAKSALISLLLALLSCAFLISVLRPSYAYGEKYMTYLKGGSETVSQDAQKLADEQNALNNEINDYQNNHNTGGVKQAELPVELEEKIIDFSQKNSQAGAGLDSMFSLIEGELYSQQNALKLLSKEEDCTRIEVVKMEIIGNLVVPVSIALIIIFGFCRKVPLFEAFTDGAKEGIVSMFSIAPSLIGLITAVSMLRASGFFEILTDLLSPVTSALGFPSEILPLALMRPVSGSGSFALLNDLFKSFSPDSFIGRTASVIAGSTETTFYAIAVYYGSVGIQKTGYTIPAALMSDFAGMVLAPLTIRLLGN